MNFSSQEGAMLQLGGFGRNDKTLDLKREEVEVSFGTKGRYLGKMVPFALYSPKSHECETALA